MPRNRTASSQPFPVLVLTTEYIVDGLCARDTDLCFPDSETIEPTLLSDARMRALRAGGAPRHVQHFALWGGSAVALVPEANASARIIAALWNLYETPRPGLYFAGPYQLRGCLMLLRREYMEETLPMVDVTISCELPGCEWAGVSAPFALLYTRWLHGYEPE
jgi:hypothetical protein